MTDLKATGRHVWMPANGCPFCAADVDHGDDARVLVLAIEGAAEALVLVGDPETEPMKFESFFSAPYDLDDDLYAEFDIEDFAPPTSQSVARTLVSERFNGFGGREPRAISQIVAAIWKDIATEALGYSDDAAFAHVNFVGAESNVTWFENGVEGVA